MPLLSRNGTGGFRLIILITVKPVYYKSPSGQKATALPSEYFIGLSAMGIGFQI